MPKKRRHPGYSISRFEPSDSPDYVVAELRYDSGVAIAAGKRGGFAAPAAAEDKASALNEVLSGFDLKRVAPHFDVPEENLAARTRAVVSPRATVKSDYALGGFVQIVPKRSGDAKKIAARLSRSRSVWQAYVAPHPEPAAMNEGSMIGSRNFEPAQGYLHSAPNGIGAMHVWPMRGGKGRGVRICDIEGNWNRAHEDLPARIPLLGGTVIPSLDWKNHGTAVLGEMVSKPGDVGTVGIAHEASAAVHSFRIGGVDNTAGAILGAAAQLKKGDVILIELHAPGPTGNYVAMQYWDDVFAAIRTAVDRGIVVVEAAGNGGENFDAPIYAGTGLQKDAGAIVVGAGIPPTDFFDNFGSGPGTRYTHIGVQRSRIWFSNYGKIVNVQGWGWHVTSCGYGDAQGGNGGKENAWYTHRFSGTSSASPIVTGAAAVLQGVSLVRNGGPLSPQKVRDILVKTGTPQVAGPGVPLSQHIGPLPNLVKAVPLV